MLRRRALTIIFAFFATFSLSLNSMAAEAVSWEELISLWENSASYCLDPVRNIRFPSKENCEQDERDGDMVLFGGLMCAAGDKRGCDLVRDSQAGTGQWYRSPRYASNPTLKTKNSLSHDMALGIQLYAVTTSNSAKFQRWIEWLHSNTDNCNQVARFTKRPCYCIDDNEFGCTMRPGDTAILGETVDYFHRAGTLPPLPNGVLRGALGTKILFDAPGWVLEGAKNNKPGYSQHITGVEILLLRKLGLNQQELNEAATKLSEKNPWNPFFLYLKEGPTKSVEDLTLQYCPQDQANLPKKKDEWTWEREMSDKAWERGILWDCIFMAKLLKK